MTSFGIAGSKLYEESALDEISRWPGASVEFTTGSKHAIALVKFGGQMRKQFYPMSPSDARGHLNFAQDIRRALTGMGAQRSPKPPRSRSEPKTKSRPRQQALSSPKPIPRQDEDRWITPLKALKEAMEGKT